jgi:hypothetical protein
MPLTPQQSLVFEELLLNKVKKMHWNYFEIDLNNDVIIDEDNFLLCNDEKNVTHFLDQIKFIDGEYILEEGPLELHQYRQLVSDIIYMVEREPSILSDAMERIFKNNRIVNNSDAHLGKLGELNKKDRNGRQRKFWKRINDGLRNKQGHYTILAEGDSWFQFPKLPFLGIDVVNDIVDHLHDDEKFNTYSLAAGGDWLSNIMHTGEYIRELPIINPDAFLISGGGNDLVGNMRLATMIETGIDNDGMTRMKNRLKMIRREQMNAVDFQKYELGLQKLNTEFFNFLNICFIEYFVFFHNLIIKSSKYKRTLFITQGYDYAIPSDAKMRNFNPFQGLINYVNGSGKWLYSPLMLKGVTDKTMQQACLFTMIYEFNEMLINIGSFRGFPNVFHIDSRGFAKWDDWYDELHLKSKSFKLVAQKFQQCIKENSKLDPAQMRKEKVYKVLRN